MTRRAAWWAVTALTLVSASAVGWHQWRGWTTIALPEPVRAEWEVRPQPSLFHTDGASRPATLKQMLQEVDAVVLARMDTSETDEVRLGTPGARHYYTGFRFAVVEPVTGDPRRGDHVTIWRWGIREDREEFFLRPQLGETFVFFLKRYLAPGGYVAPYAQYGTYQITNGMLHQLRPHPTTERYEGKPVETFLGDLKELSEPK